MTLYPRVKRAGDAALAGLGLIVTAPLMAATAAAVAVKLGRPVLFTQERPGLGGEIFTLYKFRSMKEVSQFEGPVSDADRLTPFGQSLRASSLDELPSLWNVLRGDMSLVGPRPLLPEYLELYSARQARRHEVRPGITGLAQVSGRNAISWEQKLELDVHYVENFSLALDVMVLWRTVRSVLTREGISADGEATATRFRGSIGSEQRA
ncbi:sugar transferase [Micrococcus luteus]|nr:sugar transferase [Micrococcus luteus]MCV7556923.1 sugar transferase [Micrococcus luteus]